MLEGLKSGKHRRDLPADEIAPNLYYRWKDEVEQGAKAALPDSLAHFPRFHFFSRIRTQEIDGRLGRIGAKPPSLVRKVIEESRSSLAPAPS